MNIQFGNSNFLLKHKNCRFSKLSIRIRSCIIFCGLLSKTLMEKSQDSSQPQVQSQVPIQISHEQLQQLQQLQLHHALGNIQVKQEYQNQQNAGHVSTDTKSQILDVAPQQQLQSMHVIETQPQNTHQSSANISISPQAATTINALSPLQSIQANQMSTDWQPNRLQVLPQTIQNFPLQQLYTTTTGQPVMMSGNILGSQQQIQLITAGKTFPSSSISAQQVLTTSAQNKQVMGNSNQNFNSAYTLPTGNQSQTLVLSPFIQTQQQQQNALSGVSTLQSCSKQANQQETVSKQVTNQKAFQKGNTVASNTSHAHSVNNASQNQQCIQVSQTQIPTQLINPLQQSGTQTAMQFTAGSWLQGGMPFWTTNGIQSSALLAPNSIVIRGTNPDGTHGMFLQPASHLTQQTLTPQQQNRKLINI